jgi:NADH-quinone oxidoreductase subunit F
MGISLREIIFDIGGGIPKGRKFKAVQTGGPSGGCIPEQFLDIPVDFDELVKLGSMMGSGGMIIMDDQTCMVDVARYFLTFLEEESCGKCTPCREGILQMREILDRITQGLGQEDDIETLEQMGQAIIDGSLCALGGSAPNPVLSTIRYFREEYMAHIRDHKCPAGNCKALISYSINQAACTGCGACLKACGTNAITGEKKKPHTIDPEKCIKCGACVETCKFNAVEVS